MRLGRARRGIGKVGGKDRRFLRTVVREDDVSFERRRVGDEAESLGLARRVKSEQQELTNCEND